MVINDMTHFRAKRVQPEFRRRAPAAFGLLIFFLVLLAGPGLARESDWPNVGGDKGGTRYSTLKQINRDNVKDLAVAWVYRTGDAGKGSTIECTPIVVDGVMYVTTVTTKVVALEADNGCARWTYDPYADVVITQPRASGGVNRGLAYWKSGRQTRIFAGTSDGRLISLDAQTGKPDPAFGKAGVVDLREGMEMNLKGVNYGPTSAPAVYRDIVILGFSCPEGGPPAPGDPRAFDAKTGKELWRFHTIPRPGEFGNESWEGDSWKRGGGANNWGGASIDEERGLIFLGTGSASPIFTAANARGTISSPTPPCAWMYGPGSESGITKRCGTIFGIMTCHFIQTWLRSCTKAANGKRSRRLRKPAMFFCSTV